MTRLTGFLLHNWPLKLGALLLASVLYVGFVLSLNVRVWSGTLPVDALPPPPAGATLLSDLEPVTVVRYRAPLDVFVSPRTFQATADLSSVEARPGGPAIAVPIAVTARDSRVQVIGYEPDMVQVHLDPVEETTIDVDVVTGTVPEGLNLSAPQIEPSAVTVRGASSRVAAISQIVARVPIDASALNVDRDVDLQAIDEQGNPVPGVELDPGRARVRIAVARELANRTLPVAPQLNGTVSPGLRLASIEVRPVSVTVSGEETIVTNLQSAPTEPIDLTGRTRDFELDIPLALPPGVTVTGPSQVHVAVSLAEQPASQTFNVGVTPTDADASLIYSLSTTQVAVTLAGPLSELNDIAPEALVAGISVSGLEPGVHNVAVTFEPPDGLELVAINPTEIEVIVTEPSGEGRWQPWVA